MLRTIDGNSLPIKGSGAYLAITGGKGNTTDISIPNVYQSNGMILMVNKD